MGEGLPHWLAIWPGPRGRSVSQSTHPVLAAAGPHVAWAVWDLWLAQGTGGCHWGGGLRVAVGRQRKSPPLPKQLSGHWQPPHSLSTHAPMATPSGEASSSTFSPEAVHFMVISSAIGWGWGGQEGRNQSIEMARGRGSARLVITTLNSLLSVLHALLAPFYRQGN